MRNRWFHKPLLHSHHSGGKKVSWLELFYDLVFVAAFIQLGDALGGQISVGGFVAFAGLVVPLWVAWTGFTIYANRFTVDDFLHRALVFIKMFAVAGMAIAAPRVMSHDGDPSAYALGFAVALACIAAMHWRAYQQVPDARAYCRYWGGAFFVAAVVWAVSVALPRPWCYGLWLLGTLALLSAPISKHSRVLMQEAPMDMDHLSERFGLLTIIVLGESFVKVLSALATDTDSSMITLLLSGCTTLLVTCCIWWIYFDDVGGARVREGTGSWVMWLYAHIPLTIGIIGVGVSLKKALTFNLTAVPDEAYRWLLAATVAVTLVSVAIIDSVTERRQAELSDRARVSARLASAGLVLLLAPVGSSMSGTLFLGIVTAICFGQVVFDLMMAPLEEHAASMQGQKSVAELARAHASGVSDKPARLHRDITEAVRKGTPSDLRRDLYFFFVEGSWIRMLLSFVFAYLVLNVFFACLYLLEPGSVHSADGSFLSAFAFSVQTMSTIGYGAMSPATAYGDFVVTLEAAVGILGVALATGFMFAKASRPRSSVLFSEPIVITKMHGKPTLVFRAGNARGNEVVDASVSVAAVCDEFSEEGHHTRRLHDLKLVRARTPLFTLSWTVMHVIDEDSPLHSDDPAAAPLFIALVVTLMGHDSTYGQTVHARHTYHPEDLRAGQRFVDVISELADGRLMIDYTSFHDTEVDADPVPLSAG